MKVDGTSFKYNNNVYFKSNYDFSQNNEIYFVNIKLFKKGVNVE